MGTVPVRCGYGRGAVCGNGMWVRHVGTVHGSSTRVRCEGTCDKAGSGQLLFHRYCMGRVGMGWEGQRPLPWVLIK